MDASKMRKMFVFCIAGSLLIVMGFFANMFLPQNPAMSIVPSLLGITADLIFTVLVARHLLQERRLKRNLASQNKSVETLQ